MISVFMYHDIRDNFGRFSDRYNLKSFLTTSDFCSRLDRIQNQYQVITPKEICKDSIESKNRYAILTFDDGLKDHLHVCDILSERKLVGTFFIPANPILNKAVIQSHKIQFILASVDHEILVNEILNTFPIHISGIIWDQYSISKHQNNWWTKEMVFVTNFLRYHDSGSRLTDSLFKKYVTKDEPGFSEEFYLNDLEIKKIISSGMLIGGHGYISENLTNLKCKKTDISLSLKFIEKYSESKIFSYPNGGFDNDCVDFLNEAGCNMAFTTVPRNISMEDNMLLLPRFDGAQC